MATDTSVTTEKKMGRRKRPPQSLLNCPITVHFTAFERDEIYKLANEHGVSASLLVGKAWRLYERDAMAVIEGGIGNG